MLEPPRGATKWVKKITEAEQQLREAQRLNRRPKDIPNEEAVSEDELYSNGDDDSEGLDNKCILG